MTQIKDESESAAPKTSSRNLLEAAASPRNKQTVLNEIWSAQ